jgi:DNA gyrase/topoisomerase IV subunit B
LAIYELIDNALDGTLGSTLVDVNIIFNEQQNTIKITDNA